MILNISLPGKAGKAEFAYSGAYTQKQITSGGVTYDLYTLTGSGTLTVTGTAKNVDIWCCGGGATDTTGTSWSSITDGWAGAYCAQVNARTLSGSYTVTTGAATGASSFGSLLTANGASGHSGGTGGGKAGNTTGTNTGDGITKYPFGDSQNFECHCAGGGGQANVSVDDSYGYGAHFAGGNGGTNGGNGLASAKYKACATYEEMDSAGTTYSIGGTGGVKGGGYGASYGAWNTSWTNTTKSPNATFYGSGAGGGRNRLPNSMSFDASGSGYQGVVYIRVPV